MDFWLRVPAKDRIGRKIFFEAENNGLLIESLNQLPFAAAINERTSYSLISFVKKLANEIAVKAKLPNVEIVLAGMQIPPNLGIEYTNGFESIFPNLAKTHKIHLIPFLLEGVAGNPSLNQADGIHPTAEGTKRVVENVWKVIESLLVK